MDVENGNLKIVLRFSYAFLRFFKRWGYMWKKNRKIGNFLNGFDFTVFKLLVTNSG